MREYRAARAIGAGAFVVLAAAGSCAYFGPAAAVAVTIGAVAVLVGLGPRARRTAAFQRAADAPPWIGVPLAFGIVFATMAILYGAGFVAAGRAVSPVPVPAEISVVAGEPSIIPAGFELSDGTSVDVLDLEFSGADAFGITPLGLGRPRVCRSDHIESNTSACQPSSNGSGSVWVAVTAARPGRVRVTPVLTYTTGWVRRAVRGEPFVLIATQP